MEFIFILLLIFFFVLLYVVPVLAAIVVIGFVIKWISNKFSEHGEPNDDYPAQWECEVCGDSEDWHKHVP